MRPLLLLDVDGVLNPFAAAACPAGYAEFALFPDEEPVRLCAGHADWLAELAGAFDLVWATGWGPEANRLLAPILGLPQLPVIVFPPIPFEAKDKVPAIAEFTAGRAAAWIDDALTPEADEWMSGRTEPTLLIGIDPAEGLTRRVVDHILAWAAGLARPWVVWRQDDSGNRYEVIRKEIRADAEAVAARMEARGHKQTYWVARAE